MKLIARHIKKTGFSEDWLKKLSHQTIAKMLSKTSTPLYEFWACLHLYLIEEHGPIDITPAITDADIFGKSVARFASIADLDEIEATLSNDHIALIAWTNAGKSPNVYLAATFNHAALTLQDELKQTALHKATKDRSGLLVRILIETANRTPFMRDKNDQRPLDLAGRQQNKAAELLLLPVTYPTLFLQAELMAELEQTTLERVKRYAKFQAQMRAQTKDRKLDFSR